MLLVPVSRTDLDELHQALEESFPICERRPREALEEMAQNPLCRLAWWREEGQWRLLHVSWHLEEVVFWEYVAVAPSLRGRGLASSYLQNYLKQKGRKDCLLLEVEAPETDLQQRRVAFYERLGFELLPQDYWQAPLREGDEPTPLRLMCYGERPTEERLGELTKQLAEKVYWQVNFDPLSGKWTGERR